MTDVDGARARPNRTVWLLILALAPLSVLSISAGYELAYALGWLQVGDLPGQGPPGHETAVLAGLVALIFGAVLCAALAFQSARDVPLIEWLAPAGAAFVTARFFTFDPYYAPQLRRFSDGGFVSEGWVLVLIVAAAIAALAVRRWSSPGYALSSFVLVLAVFTAALQGAGH
ncbi:MAG: hypothetical protein GEU75_11845 [Dehalococcoidia bacterium]|nr:hypothetical protein [Dehalococcoidia bacterium]